MQVEAQPVRVVLALAAHRLEEALGRGVGPDHQGHVAQPGQDLGPGVVDGLGPRGAGGVGRGDPGPGPPQGLGEGGPGDEAGVAVADGVGPGHVLDVGPGQAGLGQGVPGRGQPVLHEVAAPLAPRVHARTQHGDALVVRHRPAPSLRPSGTGAEPVGPPLPHHVLVLVVLVEGVEDQLHLVAHVQVVDADAGHHLAHHHHLLGGQLDGGDGEGDVGVGGHVGLGGLVAGVGVRPDPAGAAQLGLGELPALALGVPAEVGLLGEGEVPARGAPAAEQGGSLARRG